MNYFLKKKSDLSGYSGLNKTGSSYQSSNQLIFHDRDKSKSLMAHGYICRPLPDYYYYYYYYYYYGFINDCMKKKHVNFSTDKIVTLYFPSQNRHHTFVCISGFERRNNLLA